MMSIAKAGASAVILIVETYEEVCNLFIASSDIPPLTSDAMLYLILVTSSLEIGFNITELNQCLKDIPEGTIAFSIYMPSGESSKTQSYNKLWSQLDPAIYQDVDNDRSSLNPTSYYIADSLFSLALMYQ